MAVAHGHGQRVISALVGISTETPPTFEITYSFDVAMLFDGAVPVDRAWVNSQPKADLEAIAADTEEYLTGMVSWRFGGDEVSGMFAFPDFAHL